MCLYIMLVCSLGYGKLLIFYDPKMITNFFII
nr:MAG TPA: hypothetical protein [Caudoviricetes sp.]